MPVVFAMPMALGSGNALKAEANPAAAEPAAKKAKKLEDGALPVCKYGQQCFRKNPQHFKEFAHPWLDK